MLIAHISDLHIGPPGGALRGRVDTAGFLRRAVDRLIALEPRPDIVVVTGDLADDGTPEQYRVIAAELARLPMPTYAIPGNHDSRGPFRAGLPPSLFPGAHPEFVQFTLDAGPLRLVFLDSLNEGRHPGVLCEQRLAWAEAALAAAPGPVIVLLHHPPFETGIGFMDTSRLVRGVEELERLVARSGRVQRVLCGHVHRPIQRLWAGTIAQIAPSVAHQVSLALGPPATATFLMEPPAFLLHRWTEGAGLLTHQVYVDPYPGPFPFA